MNVIVRAWNKWHISLKPLCYVLPSQFFPLKPSLHVHSNPSPSFIPVHVPPFLQGFGWHLFCSVYKIHVSSYTKNKYSYSAMTISALFAIETLLTAGGILYKQVGKVFLIYSCEMSLPVKCPWPWGLFGTLELDTCSRKTILIFSVSHRNKTRKRDLFGYVITFPYRIQRIIITRVLFTDICKYFMKKRLLTSRYHLWTILAILKYSGSQVIFEVSLLSTNKNALCLS